jgi:hypothetical protein
MPVSLALSAVLIVRAVSIREHHGNPDVVPVGTDLGHSVDNELTEVVQSGSSSFCPG